MINFTRVTIGIQARSGSHRLPGKIEHKLGSKTILSHVIGACLSATEHINRFANIRRVLVNTALCVPANDRIVEAYRDEVDIVEGPEDDVLTRYVMLADKFDSDYIVRITADCPLIVPALIGKHITIAVVNGYDYTSNVDEQCRTSPDGYDCEVISKKLLLHTHDKAIIQSDREHVTTWIRRERPSFAKMGFVINPLDRSDFKISIDTDEDEKKITREFEKVREKHHRAIEIYGKKNVHSFS